MKKDKLDILYFHQHFVSAKGAGAIRSYLKARKLIERGHNVTMVCGSAQGSTTGLSGDFINGHRRGLVDGIDVIEFNLRYSNRDDYSTRIRTFLSFVVRSIKIVLSQRFDLIIAVSTPLTAGIPGVLARWLLRKPFVFEVGDLWPELPKAMGVINNPLILWILRVLERVIYHSAHRLIGLAPGIVEGIQAHGIPLDRIVMIPNGCDLDIFSTKVEPWRPEGIGTNDLLAVFAGTHGMANGLDAVLDAGAELKRRGRNDIKLLLIGDGKLKPRLQERSRREGLNNVVFHEPVNKTRLAGLMQTADLGMQILANVPAFYYGTSPNKFFDYIAAGLPVLNNYPGWLADMIEVERCGYVVPPGDSVAFADALERAAGDRGQLKVKGVNGRCLAVREFSRTKLSGEWADWVEGAYERYS